MGKSTTARASAPRRDTRLTQKGQVTIPLPIRDYLGLKPRDRVRFEIVDGQVLVVPAPSGIERHFASIPSPTPTPDWRTERDAFQDGTAANSDSNRGE
jgi:AbrB family looped-hinge helix DNA binding protein